MARTSPACWCTGVAVWQYLIRMTKKLVLLEKLVEGNVDMGAHGKSGYCCYV